MELNYILDKETHCWLKLELELAFQIPEKKRSPGLGNGIQECDWLTVYYSWSEGEDKDEWMEEGEMKVVDEECYF